MVKWTLKDSKKCKKKNKKQPNKKKTMEIGHLEQKPH